METVGFVGLGLMGRPMARNLLAGGVPLLIFDREARACEESVRLGAEMLSPEKLAAGCSLIFLMLPDGKTVKEFLFGKRGIADVLSPDSLIVDMSSVLPSESRYCRERLAQSGVHFLDAPVSGGCPKAEDGTLAFMVGGEQEDYERALPFFMKMGSTAVRVGGSGSGSCAKLVNQIIVNLTIAAVSEAFVLGAKTGVDMEKVYEAIRGGLAGSNVLDAKVPLILKRDFRPGGKISINRKDIGNALQTAHEVDCPVPFTAQLYEVIQTMKAKGHMEEDHGAIVQYFEQLAGIQV